MNKKVPASAGKDQRPAQGFPIVAIGASAGGLEAVKELLMNLAPDTGLGYVYVQHLDPTHESILSGILAKSTKMKVVEAENMMRMERNHLYIIPPNKDMVAIDGVLTLNPREPKPAVHMPIDKFFISLAEKHKEGAIGIVLSGNANDGTAGLRAIKTAGGITFAQDDSAKFNGMPKSAIAEGVVDVVLPPAEIAKELERISKQADVFSEMQDNEGVITDSDENLVNILQVLKKSVGVDFSHYKMATIKRRILRRMVLYKIETLADYYQYLKKHTGEVTVLYQDLLINVTCFFRDPEAMDFLKKIIFPCIIAAKNQNDPVRIWVPACSSGEEAYSLAIILVELLEGNKNNIAIQIFATDLSEIAIAKARLGIYSAHDVADMPESRLNKFFIKTDGKYRVNKHLRDVCIFAQHNIFKDPPFSRLDMVSCCNLFIYLDTDLQKKIIATFYYALNPAGYMVLGKSETTGSSGQLFSQVDKKFKVYVKKSDSSAKALLEMNYRLPSVEKIEFTGAKKINTKPYIEVASLDKTVDTILQAKYIPGSVVINSEMEILQFRGSTSLFLEPSPGKASFNLMKMARAEIVFELRNTIHKATRTAKPAKKEGLEFKIKDKVHHVSVEAIPITSENDEKLFLVIFEELHEPVHDTKTAFSKDEIVNKLREELNTARDDMRSIIEEQEVGKEELQSANEEIISSNEELQSINEELETSKEEVESTNEELMTINGELQVRNEQLLEAQEYSEAIFETIQEAVLVLDKDLRVIMANNAFYKTFKVKEEHTRGELLYELGNRQWDMPKLREVLHKVLRYNTQFTGFEVEHDFPEIGKKSMVLNARKIAQKSHHSELVLLAIEDITEHRKAEKLIMEREEWFRNMADNAPVMIWTSGADKLRTFFNVTWLNYTGRSFDEEKGDGWITGIHPEDRNKYLSAYNKAFETKTSFQVEYHLRRNDGVYRWVLAIGKPTFTPEGKFTGFVGTCTEIHDKKVTQEELEQKVDQRTHDLQQLNKELERSNSELQQFAYVASHDLQEPLRKIMTFSERLLANKGQLPETDQKYVEKISTSTQRMALLIDDLLDFSRISRNGDPFVKTDLNKIYKNVLNDFELILSQKKGAIKCSGLPVIEAIPLQMEQLFHNLISNALKFSKEDTPPRITISSKALTNEEVRNYGALKENETYYELIFKDNGIGFENEYAEQIFVIFQRLNDRHSYPGTGIGLSLCRKIVNNHGGKIYATSIEGEGAEFHVVLPEKQA